MPTPAGKILLGGGGANVLSGGAGNDLVVGGRGNDTLSGGAGDDIVWGGKDNDLLYGGAGADRFLYTFGDLGDDVIVDFDAQDVIDFRLSCVSFDDLLLVESNGGTFVKIDLNGDGTYDSSLYTNNYILSEADFIF